jgi:hypothetical protein
MQSQKGFQHGKKRSVLKKYAKYVKSPAIRRKPSKRRRGKERASKAVVKRWKGDSVRKVCVGATSPPPAQWEIFEPIGGC